MARTFSLIGFLLISTLLVYAGSEINIRNYAQLKGAAGKQVIVNGQVSDMPWQHIISEPKGYKHMAYFDLEKGQTIIYAKTPIDCKGPMLVYGTVVTIEGSSKRPGAKEIHTEYHVKAERWECLKK